MPRSHELRAPARAAPTSTRLAFIDNLRVALTVLVVAHHVALPFGNLGIWPNWQEPSDALAALPLDLFVLLNQSYFMGFFFLLSGLFLPRSADRRGPGGLARERLRRLGIPLLVALLTVRPLYALPEYLDQPAAVRGPYWRFFLTDDNVGPLWFLGVLLVLTLAYTAVRRVRPATVAATVEARAGEAMPLGGRQVIAFTLILGVVLYVWRMFVPVGTSLLGVPSASHLPQYAALFAVGVLAYRRGWMTALPRRTGLLGGGLILASLVPMVGLRGFETLAYAHSVPTTALPHLGFALWEALFGIGAILVLIAAFRRRLTADGPLARFLAANAFAVYLVHAPVIVGYVALVAPLELPPVAAFALVLLLALATSWLIAALLRKVPAVRATV